MANLVCTVTLHEKRWTRVAVTVLAYSCAISSLFSERLAEAVSGWAATLIARYGFRYSVD
jgi:hypothetical protein